MVVQVGSGCQLMRFVIAAATGTAAAVSKDDATVTCLLLPPALSLFLYLSKLQGPRSRLLRSLSLYTV